MNCILAEDDDVVCWFGRIKVPAGTKVKVVKLSNLDSGVVMVKNLEGGFRGWCLLDNLIPVEGEE